MAGETEDCITFQAERMPTGSISFGRFELESLSWERRSTFSHNRYLEEVEKYSTPGSVTQKRAILEAHFKKKPLLPQASLENQCAAECQTAKNDLDRDASCSDKFSDHYDGRQPEFVWYDETPTGSDEHDVMECEQQETWPSEFPIESTPCSDERVVEPTYEPSDRDEILQNQPEHGSMQSNKDELCIVAEQEPDNKAVIVEELLEKKEAVIVGELLEKKESIIVKELKSDVSSKSPAVEKRRVPTLKKNTLKAPLKEKEAVEQKPAKTKLMDQLPVQQNLRKSSTERSNVSSGKMLSRSMGKLERESTPRTISVNQLPSRNPIPTSDSKSVKLEASVNMKTKPRRGNRRYELKSEKDARAKNSSITPHSISGRSEMDAHRPRNRPKRVADSSKEETKQSGANFSFKSEERAEKRKEYFMKLEEKLHAKEVEMNEIQAKTQEETEAAIKQLRRSLNFKATPMPSFYHGAVPKSSEGKKNVATPAKPQKLQSKCISPGSRTSPQEKSPSLSKATNGESPSSHEPNQAYGSVKPTEKGRKDERSKLGGNSSGKKGQVVNRVRRGGMGNVIKGSIINGSVSVHVAS